MPEETKRPWYIGRRLVSIGLAVTGLVLAGTAVFMVWTFGEGLGATPHQQIAYGVAHVALHAFGMLVAFTIGIFLIDRSFGWVAVVAVLALGVGGYGISNIAGFSAKNRISVSDAVRENDKRAIQRYEAARSDLTAKRDWAGGQSMSFEHSRYERLQFKGKESEYQKMIDELRMPQVTAATVNADAGASVLSRFFGSSDENWQVRFAVIIAVLMFIGEFFSFILCGRMWPTAATVAALGKKTQEGSEPAKGGSGGGEQGKPRLVHPAATPRTMEAASPSPPPQGGGVGVGNLPHKGGGIEPASLLEPIEITRPAGSKAGNPAEPAKVSSVGLRVSTDAPTGKLTYEQFADMIREDMHHGEPTLSTRALAARTGWSQTSVVQQQWKVRGKVNNSPVRRYAGNGGGMHTSANG